MNDHYKKQPRAPAGSPKGGQWVKEDETIDINFSARKAEEYKQFGWARKCGAISFNELEDLYSKIHSRRSLDNFKHSSNGEAIIEVNDNPKTTLGVDNVFVFVKGTKNNFNITRVVRFQAETETEMEILREDLYEGRSCNNSYIAIYQEEGLATEYRPENWQSFAEYSKGRSERETRRATDRDNRGREKYRSGYYLHVGEDGEVTEFFPTHYKNGSK